MEKNDVLEFLEARLAVYKETEPQAFNLHAAYQNVINDLLNEEDEEDEEL